MFKALTVFFRRRIKPSSLVKISVDTNANAFVGLLAVDQSVSLLHENNDITQDLVVKELETYDEVSRPSPWFRSRRSLDTSTLLTSSDAFSNAGLILLTDANIQSSTANSKSSLKSFGQLCNLLLYISVPRCDPLSNSSFVIFGSAFYLLELFSLFCFPPFLLSVFQKSVHYLFALFL